MRYAPPLSKDSGGLCGLIGEHADDHDVIDLGLH